MTRNFDHYEWLIRAVFRLDSNSRESYQARGAIYDQARKALVQRLLSSDPPYTAEEAAAQQAALRDAIRRVESVLVSASPINFTAETAVQETIPRDTIRPFEISIDPDENRFNEKQTRKLRAQSKLGDGAAENKRNSIFRQLAARVIIASLILGVGILGYAYLKAKPTFPSLAKALNDIFRLTSPVSTNVNAPPKISAAQPKQLDAPKVTQKAILFEGDPRDTPGNAFVGEATWRNHSETNGASTKSRFIVTFDVKIPQRGLALSMSIRRDREENVALSHLIEFRIAPTENMPHGVVSDLLGVIMAKNERANGTALIGKVAKVGPGFFLFGLSGAGNDIQINISLLKEMAWMHIPIVFTDGLRGTIAIEKGKSGKRSIDDAIDNWNRK